MQRSTYECFQCSDERGNCEAMDLQVTSTIARRTFLRLGLHSQATQLKKRCLRHSLKSTKWGYNVAIVCIMRWTWSRDVAVDRNLGLEYSRETVRTHVAFAPSF